MAADLEHLMGGLLFLLCLMGSPARNELETKFGDLELMKSQMLGVFAVSKRTEYLFSLYQEQIFLESQIPGWFFAP